MLVFAASNYYLWYLTPAEGDTWESEEDWVSANDYVTSGNLSSPKPAGVLETIILEYPETLSDRILEARIQASDEKGEKQTWESLYS